MVLMTKFFSRVKFVRPTDSELSITNTMSRAPQRFSQSAEHENVVRVWLAHRWIFRTAVTGLTTAATGFPDVVHHIAFLLADIFTVKQLSVSVAMTAVRNWLMFSRSGQDLPQVQDLPAEKEITLLHPKLVSRPSVRAFLVLLLHLRSVRFLLSLLFCLVLPDVLAPPGT